MKIEVELLGLKNGELTEFRYEGTVYYVSSHRAAVSKPRPSKKEILGRDKTYGIDVTVEESQKVRNAIMQTSKDYVPTTDAIVKETGLPLNRVRAIIHLLKERGVVKSKVGQHMQPVHRLVNK